MMRLGLEGAPLLGAAAAVGAANGMIDCSDGFGDCAEIIHEGETPDLYAFADERLGVTFGGWSGERCPCAGSTDPTCIVDASIGEYDERASIDEANPTHRIPTGTEVRRPDCGQGNPPAVV